MKQVALLICITLLNTNGIAQNLQSSEWVINPNTIDASDLAIPYTAGEVLPTTINLQATEDLSVNNVSNQVKWCIYAQLTPSTTANCSIVVTLGYNSPPVCVDALKTNYTLELNTVATPFISGKGTLNKGVVSYSLDNCSLPETSSEQYQIVYTIQTGSCPL